MSALRRHGLIAGLVVSTRMTCLDVDNFLGLSDCAAQRPPTHGPAFVRVTSPDSPAHCAPAEPNVCSAQTDSAVAEAFNPPDGAIVSESAVIQ